MSGKTRGFLTPLAHFITQAKKKECTEIILEPVFYQEKKIGKASGMIVVITFNISCIALKEREEVASYMQHFLTFTPSASKTETRSDVARYYASLKKRTKKMVAEIKISIPTPVTIKPASKKTW